MLLSDSSFGARFKSNLCHPSITSQDIICLVDILQLPGEIFTHNNYWFSCVEAFTLTCARLASAGDEFDLCTWYNRSQSSISEIFNKVVTLLDEHWDHLLQFNSDHLFSPANLKCYSDTIYKCGAPLQGVWGFINCTVWPMCYPSNHQHQVYNGHKHFHNLKYQAVMLLNGLFGHLFSPIEGCHNNTFTLAESRLINECTLHAKLPVALEDGDKDTSMEPCCLQLFGDLAYGLNRQIISLFLKSGQTDD